MFQNKKYFQKNLTLYLFQILNEFKIKYCVLRNFEDIPKSTNGSDLDILIFNESVHEFNKEITNFIKENNLRLVSFIRDNNCPKYCISTNNWGIQIDAFNNGVFFGNKQVISSSVLKTNTENHNGVFVLKPKAGSVLAFLKELLNNRVPHAKYIKELQYHFKENPIEDQLLSQFTPQFINYINDNLHKLDDKHCLELYKLSNVSFKRSKFIDLRNKISRFFNHPGFTIAFLGTDGSGKSTIIENIKPTLFDGFHKAVYYEHLRPNKLPSIAKLLGKQFDFDQPVTNPHGSTTSGFLGSLFRWSYYMLDYTFGFYLKIWPKKAIRSCVWIFDRYYYDYLIDPKRARIKLPQWILKTGQFLIPEPDLILCLGTDAKAIHQRKPELTLKEVDRQVAALKKFSTTHKHAIWIDTGNDIETSTHDTMEAIINMMAKRFEKVNLSK